MPNVLSTCTRHKALRLSLHFNSFCKLEPWSVSRNTAGSCLSSYAPAHPTYSLQSRVEIFADR